MICNNISVNEKGHLTFAGQDTTLLAERYGTPLYLLDEDRVRENCRTYVRSLSENFSDSLPLYASKALCFKKIYNIVADEGMGIDIVSSGELYTAVKAGFPMERAYFHGNNKTPYDVAFAMEHGVGYFVCDNPSELKLIDNEAARRGIRQKILLRLTPGIDPHTHKAITTGNIDSKFGEAIETGQAEDFVAAALLCKNIDVRGYHCHIGSQIFNDGPFSAAAIKMLRFSAIIKRKYGFEAPELNLGGGFGVRYIEQHPKIDCAAEIKKLAVTIKNTCATLGLREPKILMEPGRSIVADAGMTLYTIGCVKEIPGFKNYVSVDGGMADNPRYALYQAEYTAYIANRAAQRGNFVCTIAGCCCESGDIIGENFVLPKPSPGDILAVCTTGAYNYSMASNYNRLPRPPIVILRGGESYIGVKRETFDDLIANDV